MKVRGAMAAAVGVVVLLGMWLGGLAGHAGAHTNDQSYLYLDITENHLGGRAEFPFVDVRSVLGLSLEGSTEEVEAELAANQQRLQDYAADHLEIGSAGTTLRLDYLDVEILESDEDWAEYVVVPFVARLAGQEPPRSLEVRFDPFFDEIEGRDALLLIGNDWNAGVIDNADEVLVGFDADTRARTVDLEAHSWWKNLTASVGIGLDHIRTGPDHILFVFVLLLPAVLVFTVGSTPADASGSWAPGHSFGGGLWRVLKIATMFTVAHSITFTLAGLDLIPLPPAIVVESIIAASIAAAALHNLWPLAPNREWALAFVFGLFHGLGFASLVSSLDVSRSTQLVSLLGRNIGIEIGQVIVILLAFPALFLARRLRYYRPFYTVASIALAVVATGWLIERLFETDLSVNAAVDRVIAFPRSVLIAALATGLAGLAFWWEARAGRLLAVHEQDEASSTPTSPPPPPPAGQSYTHVS